MRKSIVFPRKYPYNLAQRGCESVIQRIIFKVDSPSLEFTHFNADQLPYACLLEPMERHVDATISWHWHQCYEIVYVTEGAMECHTPDQVVRLEKGEAVFVSAGVLHRYRQVSQTPCVLYAHIFDASFLIGQLGSRLYQKYIYPISKSPDIQLQAIRPENYHQKRMLECLQNMVELARQEPFGYEFQLQHQLSQFWCRLLTLTSDQQSSIPSQNDSDISRIKQMLGFIHQNYAQPLTLQQIADSAAVSQRECSRCFQRCFQMSAISYLLDYRIRAAARMLLETDQSITQISKCCGFCSASYFGKRFQEAFGCSPRDYRHRVPQAGTELENKIPNIQD